MRTPTAEGDDHDFTSPPALAPSGRDRRDRGGRPDRRTGRSRGRRPHGGPVLAGTLTWPVGTIASGGTATLTIVANRVFASSLTITAAVTSSDQGDPDAANDTASVRWPASETDLVLAKAVDNPTARTGSSVTFLLTVSNAGSITANGVEVTDLLPPGLTFVSATPSAGSYDSSTGVWILAVLVDPGDVLTLTIVATRTADGAITNTATLSSAGLAALGALLLLAVRQRWFLRS